MGIHFRSIPFFYITVLGAILVSVGCTKSDNKPAATGTDISEVKAPVRKVTDAQPISLPPTLRIEPAAPRGDLWAKLTEKQKNFAYHLLAAATAGRTLLYHQTHRHALTIRKVITESLRKKNIADTKAQLGEDAFKEYLIYSAKFLDSYGPYATSKRKYIMVKVTPAQVKDLVKQYAPKASPQDETEIVKLLTDPKYETLRHPIADDDNLEETGGNLYEKGITKEQVLEAQKKGLRIELNCRVEKRGNDLGCDIHRVSSKDVVGKQLLEIRSHLLKAMAFASSEHQKQQLSLFVKYLETGDEKDLRESSIAWIKDGTESAIDFMIGWIESYDDWLNYIGSWETYLLVVDPEVTKVTKGLAKNAQYFENLMPYDYSVNGATQSFKKTFPADYAPPAIMSFYLDEVSTIRTAGFNLPNFDDIRRDIGFKNVIKLPMPGTAANPELLALRRQVIEAFAPADKVEGIVANLDKVQRIHVLLHEIIGHGSGTYDVAKYGAEEPTRVLGPLGASLEEERADLTGLVFGADQKMIDSGLVKDQAELDVIKTVKWDVYVANDFSSAFSSRKNLTSAHIRGRFLLIAHLLEAGAIEWVSKDGSPMTLDNQVLRVKNYELCHKVAVDLLSELQRIKAMRDEVALKALFEKYTPVSSIDTPWAKALVKRGETLVSFYGFVDQPWKVSKDRQTVESQGDTTSLESIAPYWHSFYGN